MKELEVGQFVRTKDGYIAKFVGKNDYLHRFDSAIRDISVLVYDEDDMLFNDEIDEYIVKVKCSVEDLIEEGDILEINNEKYEVIYDKSYEKLGILIPSREELSIRHTAIEYVFKKYKVSIITREQFEDMSYKVGE